jgi:hypothetical protein
MSTIRIETHIESETLYLPQLRPLVGKDVEIVVHEKHALVVQPGRSDWPAVQAAVMSLEEYDADAYRQIRNIELQNRNGDMS